MYIHSILNTFDPKLICSKAQTIQIQDTNTIPHEGKSHNFNRQKWISEKKPIVLLAHKFVIYIQRSNFSRCR